jgi:hypothetical protein
MERLKMLKESDSLRQSVQNDLTSVLKKKKEASAELNQSKQAAKLERANKLNVPPHKITTNQDESVHEHFKHLDLNENESKMEEKAPEENDDDSNFKKFTFLHDKLVKLKAKENEILRTYLERKIVNSTSR